MEWARDEPLQPTAATNTEKVTGRTIERGGGDASVHTDHEELGPRNEQEEKQGNEEKKFFLLVEKTLGFKVRKEKETKKGKEIGARLRAIHKRRRFLRRLLMMMTLQ